MLTPAGNDNLGGAFRSFQQGVEVLCRPFIGDAEGELVKAVEEKLAAFRLSSRQEEEDKENVLSRGGAAEKTTPAGMESIAGSGGGGDAGEGATQQLGQAGEAGGLPLRQAPT